MEQPFLKTHILEMDIAEHGKRCYSKFTPFTPIHTPKNTRCIRPEIRKMATRQG
mgnify:CR=1 FL=1